MIALPELKEELEKMEAQREPLLPIEQKLIWWTFGTGLVLLVILVFVSRSYM